MKSDINSRKRRHIFFQIEKVAKFSRNDQIFNPKEENYGMIYWKSQINLVWNYD